MSTPGFTAEQVLGFHQSLLSAYGGLPGAPNLGALESALAQPLAEVFGVKRFPDPVAQAAAYLFFVIKAHAFVDGNKRTAAYLCVSWLLMYGYVVLDQFSFEDLAREVAASTSMTANDVVARLRALIYDLD